MEALAGKDEPEEEDGEGSNEDNVSIDNPNQPEEKEEEDLGDMKYSPDDFVVSDISIDVLPNIQIIFELFPFFMLYNGKETFDGVEMDRFKYKYPLGDKVFAKPEDESEILAYFESSTMDFKRLSIRADSKDTTRPVVLYADPTIVAKNLTLDDMNIEGDCFMASKEQ